MELALSLAIAALVLTIVVIGVSVAALYYGVTAASATLTTPIAATNGGTGHEIFTPNQLLYTPTTTTINGLTSGNNLLAATNATGTLAMRALSTNVQTFNYSASPQTYTPSTGMIYCVIEGVGGI